MKTFENLKKEELNDLNLIQGGKRVRTGPSPDGRCIRDLQKYNSDGDLLWEKFWWNTNGER